MEYIVTSDSFTKISETSGTLQNLDKENEIEMSESPVFDSGLRVKTGEKLNFSNTDIYLRCVKDGGTAIVRIVPFSVDAKGGDGFSVDNTALKSVALVGNALNFYTSSDTAQAAAYSIDIPAEQFIDQAATTFVPNFYFSAILYPDAVNPNLNGKPVFVLGVKSKSNDGLSNTVKYSFIDVSKLVDTYVESDTSVVVSDYKFKVNISPDAGNFLRLKANGLYADGVTDTATSSALGLTKLYNTTGANTDGAISQAAITTALAAKLDSDATAAKAFKDSSGNVISDTYATKTELAAASDTYATKTDLSGYVTKDGSKVLSTNDFTTAEKNKLANIADSAQVNVIESVKVNNSALTVSNKAVNVDLSNYATNAKVNSKLDSDAKAVSATTADKLSNARSLKVSLSSTSAPTFDGSANVTTIGVGGILPATYGGTGNSNGTVSGAAQLNTSRNFITNLNSTSAASFNGTASVSAGVTGTLPVANGGTGQTNLANVTVGAATKASQDSAGNVIADTYATKTALSTGLNSKASTDTATSSAAGITKLYDQLGENSDGAISQATVTKYLTAKRYGYRIRKNEADPDLRVEYLYDAVGMTPAHMVFDSDPETAGTDSDTSYFDYGSWQSVWFVADNKPCMLKTDGTVDYYLDSNDYTKKEDGSVSDVADSDTDLNAMAQFPLCWVYRYEDDNYLYEIVSNVQWDSNYKAYAHTNSSGVIRDYFYISLFEAVFISNKLRSLYNQTLGAELDASQQVNAAVANGTNWYLSSWSQHQLIRTLLVLIGKSCNTQAVFGKGYTMETKEIIPTSGTIYNKGQFFGSNAYSLPMKAFHLENFWGNQWLRLAGLVSKNKYLYTKTTPPYNVANSNMSISGYISNILFNNANRDLYISEFYFRDYGIVPKAYNGSSSTYFCDGVISSTDGSDCSALWGGARSYGDRAGAFMFVCSATNAWKDDIVGCYLSYV